MIRGIASNIAGQRIVRVEVDAFPIGLDPLCTQTASLVLILILILILILPSRALSPPPSPSPSPSPSPRLSSSPSSSSQIPESQTSHLLLRIASPELAKDAIYGDPLPCLRSPPSTRSSGPA
ncbi:uncharacterized protein Triagg1_4397 [Trichoderma aggressivum f. europaeum]|uniref:Uncharacterized protein n=1 Tax=Trichoderma aggressivum f. europaeum TaxID=173218 RepID=A0AAE1M1K1_9HYPO|nr:hypothetical protein Triagg1_4397 [Trichoderma aggressivum f. europaeum]